MCYHFRGNGQEDATVGNCHLSDEFGKVYIGELSAKFVKKKICPLIEKICIPSLSDR